MGDKHFPLFLGDFIRMYEYYDIHYIKTNDHLSKLQKIYSNPDTDKVIILNENNSIYGEIVGGIKQMIFDFFARKETVAVHVINDDTAMLGFYKKIQTVMARCDKKRCSLTKLKTYDYFADFVHKGDRVIATYNEYDERYIISTEDDIEIGELSDSVSKYVFSRTDERFPVFGIIVSREEEDEDFDNFGQVKSCKMDIYYGY